MEILSVRGFSDESSHQQSKWRSVKNPGTTRTEVWIYSDLLRPRSENEYTQGSHYHLRNQIFMVKVTSFASAQTSTNSSRTSERKPNPSNSPVRWPQKSRKPHSREELDFVICDMWRNPDGRLTIRFFYLSIICRCVGAKYLQVDDNVKSFGNHNAAMATPFSYSIEVYVKTAWMPRCNCCGSKGKTVNIIIFTDAPKVIERAPAPGSTHSINSACCHTKFKALSRNPDHDDIFSSHIVNNTFPVSNSS